MDTDAKEEPKKGGKATTPGGPTEQAGMFSDTGGEAEPQDLEEEGEEVLHCRPKRRESLGSESASPRGHTGQAGMDSDVDEREELWDFGGKPIPSRGPTEQAGTESDMDEKEEPK